MGTILESSSKNLPFQDAKACGRTFFELKCRIQVDATTSTEGKVVKSALKIISVRGMEGFKINIHNFIEIRANVSTYRIRKIIFYKINNKIFVLHFNHCEFFFVIAFSLYIFNFLYGYKY